MRERPFRASTVNMPPKYDGQRRRLLAHWVDERLSPVFDLVRDGGPEWLRSRCRTAIGEPVVRCGDRNAGAAGGQTDALVHGA